MQLAASCTDREIAEHSVHLLIDLGADLNDSTAVNEDVLISAAKRGHINLVSFLLERGLPSMTTVALLGLLFRLRLSMVIQR